MIINWWYYSSSNKEKPIIYIGDLASENKVFVQDDGGCRYVGIYKLNTHYLFMTNKKKVSNSLIQKRLNKIVDDNFIQFVKDFLDKKDVVETIL